MTTRKNAYGEYIGRLRFYKTLAVLVAFAIGTGATFGLLAAYGVFDKREGARVRIDISPYHQPTTLGKLADASKLHLEKNKIQDFATDSSALNETHAHIFVEQRGSKFNASDVVAIAAAPEMEAALQTIVETLNVIDVVIER